MKSITIGKKQYVMVNERVQEFHKLYPNGMIVTELLSKLEDEVVVFRATVVPDNTVESEKKRVFTGYSQASWNDTKSLVNTTSALENAETSAVGRALGFLGIGIVDSIATADEVNKANNTTPFTERLASDKQVAMIERMVTRKMLPDVWLKSKGLESFNKIRFADVNKYLAELSNNEPNMHNQDDLMN